MTHATGRGPAHDTDDRCPPWCTQEDPYEHPLAAQLLDASAVLDRPGWSGPGWSGPDWSGPD